MFRPSPAGGIEDVAKRSDAKKWLELDFPADLVTKPIVYQLGKDFNVVTNIRRASVTKDFGYIQLELEGEEGEIQKAIQTLVKQGVKVKPIEKDVIE